MLRFLTKYKEGKVLFFFFLFFCGYSILIEGVFVTQLSGL